MAIKIQQDCRLSCLAWESLESVCQAGDTHVIEYSVAVQKTKAVEGAPASLCMCVSSSQACPGANRKFDLSQKLEIKWLICLQSKTEMVERSNAWSYKVLL